MTAGAVRRESSPVIRTKKRTVSYYDWLLPSYRSDGRSYHNIGVTQAHNDERSKTQSSKTEANRKKIAIRPKYRFMEAQKSYRDQWNMQAHPKRWMLQRNAAKQFLHSRNSFSGLPTDLFFAGWFYIRGFLCSIP